ncbi:MULTISPECIES: DUF3592 domain-containing protein [Actinomadura]|uniref:DUF3592 domain-containing protein n=1 Tax=Actinomadura TaxID=1988 RepID=UPI0004287433|nr:MULTISPECIES: DUF3592 domain-containing protein [Actinomadura]RSN51402.1 DUF3592 domain-containing protein [Actinomadura sp. WAC 06369]
MSAVRERLRIIAIPLILLVCGVLCVTTGIEYVSGAAELSGHEARADGTVLETRGAAGPKGGGNASYRVEFTDAGGARRTFWTSGTADRGDTVDVVYDSRDPGSAIVGSTGERRATGIAVFVTGLGLLAAFAATVLALRRKPAGRRGRAAR